MNRAGGGGGRGYENNDAIPQQKKNHQATKSFLLLEKIESRVTRGDREDVCKNQRHLFFFLEAAKYVQLYTKKIA